VIEAVVATQGGVCRMKIGIVTELPLASVAVTAICSSG
jgi:hypothetical protein